MNSINEKINKLSKDLPILKNDTKNIIEYVEYQKDKNKKKYFSSLSITFFLEY